MSSTCNMHVAQICVHGLTLVQVHVPTGHQVARLALASAFLAAAIKPWGVGSWHGGYKRDVAGTRSGGRHRATWTHWDDVAAKDEDGCVVSQISLRTHCQSEN